MSRLTQAAIAAAVTAALPGAVAPPASAGEVEVVDASASRQGETWRFEVTLRHGDTGWDHYADQWQVLAPTGEVLGTRELLHPHETEQPFTRSLSGVEVPAGTDHVTIRARDSVHGMSPKPFTVELD